MFITVRYSIKKKSLEFKMTKLNYHMAIDKQLGHGVTSNEVYWIVFRFFQPNKMEMIYFAVEMICFLRLSTDFTLFGHSHTLLSFFLRYIRHGQN